MAVHHPPLRRLCALSCGGGRTTRSTGALRHCGSHTCGICDTLTFLGGVLPACLGVVVCKCCRLVALRHSRFLGTLLLTVDVLALLPVPGCVVPSTCMATAHTPHSSWRRRDKTHPRLRHLCLAYVAVGLAARAGAPTAAHTCIPGFVAPAWLLLRLQALAVVGVHAQQESHSRCAVLLLLLLLLSASRVGVSIATCMGCRLGCIKCSYASSCIKCISGVLASVGVLLLLLSGVSSS
jgi:hypothetical protein